MSDGVSDIDVSKNGSGTSADKRSGRNLGARALMILGVLAALAGIVSAVVAVAKFLSDDPVIAGPPLAPQSISPSVSQPTSPIPSIAQSTSSSSAPSEATTAPDSPPSYLIDRLDGATNTAGAGSFSMSGKSYLHSVKSGAARLDTLIVRFGPPVASAG